MTKHSQHITVCVCTHKRLALLERLLGRLVDQETGGLFTFSIVVADNDALRSAESVVSCCAESSNTLIHYCVEQVRGISLTRNKAVENATGDFIAFIDDDELPQRTWLLTLFQACDRFGADGVLGPARPEFDKTAPAWIVKGNFYTRPTYPTGCVIDWRKGRTGNVLLKARLFTAGELPFRPEFRSGEDQDFFRRMIERGNKFVWCNEAVTSEIIPPSRWKRSVLLKRALLRGASDALHPATNRYTVLKSVTAVCIYAMALPFSLLLGHHRVMGILVRLCDHLGLLLGHLRINPVHEPYVAG